MTIAHRIIGFSVSNLIVFYLAHLLFPTEVVFGNVIIGYWQAILTASVGVAFIAVLVDPVAKDFNLTFSTNAWMAIYFAVNTLAIYLFARTPISKTVGMGLSSYWVAIILGFFANLGQYLMWKATEAKEKK